MKYLLFILICTFLIAYGQEGKKDTTISKLKRVQEQQKCINEKLDSLWVKLEIDSTLRKK